MPARVTNLAEFRARKEETSLGDRDLASETQRERTNVGALREEGAQARRAARTETSINDEPLASRVTAVPYLSVVGRAGAELRVADIYPDLSAGSSLAIVFKVVPDVVARLHLARESLVQENLIAADDNVCHARALLTELFCCRDLGDGFGMLINGLMIAFENRRGIPLEATQVQSVVSSLERLLREPALDVNDAADELLALDSSGLQTDPAELDALADLDRGEDEEKVTTTAREG